MSDTTIPMQQHPAEPAHQSGRHPINVGHLVLGVAFLGVTVVWALVASDTVNGSDIRWLMPIPWVSAGIAGVLATVLTSGRRWGQSQTGWVGDPSPATPEPDPEPTEEIAVDPTEDTTETTPEENR